MSEISEILIVESDACTRAAVEAYLADHERYAGLCCVCAVDEVKSKLADGVHIYLLNADEKAPEGSVLCLSKPVRLGAVLDSVERILKRRQGEQELQSIKFQGWTLDTLYNILQPEGGGSKDVRLTEKEKDILVLLHGHTDESVSREQLLHSVWAYADGVQTHTLETHIYRLRQKLESDPANPQILLTTDTGYQLKL